MTNNLQFVELMASVGKSNSRKKLNIQLACFGLVAVSVAVFYIHQTIQEKNKVKKLNQANGKLSDVISSYNFKVLNLQQQIYHSKETIEKQKQEKPKEA
ncbi:MAG: hypothetical protein NTZ59_12945 [Bacteroidetes bacterium]|nr:hypothetical protein [Bacteroidota bacterium]